MDSILLAERVELIEESVRALVTRSARTESMERRFADIDERMVSVEGRLVVVEGQIVHLREEMHGEFSALRGDMNERSDALYERGEDTRRYVRVLHDEVLDRNARLGEGRSAL